MSALDGERREPEIALVRSADPWVDDLHRYCAAHGGARVRLMVLDPGVARDEEFDVLVAGERWPALTPAFVGELHARGRRILVVGSSTPVGPAGPLGVDAVLDPQSPPAELVAAVNALTPTGAARARVPDPELPGSPGSPGADGAGGGGGLIAVGGPFGAGSTEVAVALATAWARGGRRAVLVDADTVTPSVAVRLGLPLEPNLCSAIEVVTRSAGAVPGTLFDLGEGWPAVLVGAPNRRVASALRPGEVVAVGEALAARFDPVVVDVSGGAPVAGAADVCAEVVRRAGAVVAVGVANPVGVIRLVEWVDAFARPADGRVHLVVNRAPGGKARRAELAGELQRDLRVAGLTFVPTDPKLDDAVWAASVVERGPFARVMGTLAALLVADSEIRMPPRRRP